jgi:hypothetical protein
MNLLFETASRRVVSRNQPLGHELLHLLKDLSEKVSILYPNIDGVSNPF